MYAPDPLKLEMCAVGARLYGKNLVIANDGKMVTASEKAIAALKAEFAATANKTGRNPK